MDALTEYRPDPGRYEKMNYRRAGRSGLKLPAISLGLWHNFGSDRNFQDQRLMVRRAFDLGITHFDLANDYGPPPGAAEENLGLIMRRDLRRFRDELLVSTKAGYKMWPGPYGEWGSRKYLLASLEQSLTRLDLEYVDIFYSHRPDPETPIEETMAALDTAVRQGKALYVGVSSYTPEQTLAAARALRELGTPLVLHQPSYSMLNRWIEEGLLEVLDGEGIGCVAFTPLAQGMLTSKYLDGIPPASRASRDRFLPRLLRESTLSKVRELDKIARGREQTLAQMALAWVLRDPRVTSAVVGAGSIEQLDENVGSLERAEFTVEELSTIDGYATESGVNLWSGVPLDQLLGPLENVE